MSNTTPSLKHLSGKLCPWLQEPLETLERAHGAERLGHAWLLGGPVGIGKINLALVFANRLLGSRIGKDPPATLEPADAAAAMRARHTPQDRHADLHWLFPEDGKSSISVDQVRNVIETLERSSYHGHCKVVIIEPVDAMTIAASNALLKTLEEPREDTYLLLVSHQPGRLASTIRSRCQMLALGAPTVAAALKWLGMLETETGAFRYLGRSPLRLAELIYQDNINLINVLEDNFKLVYENKLEPQALADEWLKLDLDFVLEWLARRIQHCIRSRSAAGRSKSVTDARNEPLRSDLPALTLRTLFKQFGATERLHNQIGTGINVELAMRVLLLGFQPDREQM